MAATDCRRPRLSFVLQDCKISIADDDPARLGKMMRYEAFNKAMQIVPKVISSVESALVSNPGGIVFIVDDTDAPERYDKEDVRCSLPHLLRESEHVVCMRQVLVTKCTKPVGAIVQRMTAAYVHKPVYAAMSTDSATARAARAAVLAGVIDLGGLQAAWEERFMVISDDGEYGMQSYTRAKRWTLKVSAAAPEQNGIKRLKVA